MKLRVAKVTVVMIDISCPYCKAEIEEPDSGSLNWEVASIRDLKIFECIECGENFKLPSKVSETI